MRVSPRTLLTLLGLCAALAAHPAGAALRVFVSVPPLAPLAQRVGGPAVEVRSLVGPNQDPHSFEPSARQVQALASAHVFWAVGMPYERAWLPRLRAASLDMRVVNARATLDGRPTEGPDADGGHEHGHGDGHGHAHDEDPHVWTSPAAIRAMIGPLADALAAAAPDHAADYRANATALGAELAALDTEVRTALAPLRSRRFVVFHPAWGQFAADYGLEQIAVEQGGKEPTARALAALATRLRAEGARVVFVQPQSGHRSAETLAHEIGARLAVLDPMATDIVQGSRELVRALTEAQAP